MQESTDKSKYIPLYYSYLGQLSLLTDEQVGLLVIALLRYGRDGVEPDFPKDGSLFMAFSFIAENSNRAVERSLDGRTRGGKKRAENAQKDERGRFLSAEASSNPAQTSLSSNPAITITISISIVDRARARARRTDPTTGILNQTKISLLFAAMLSVHCKICGKPVLSARVMHPACWEYACDKMAEIFCDEYYKWPGECADKDALEVHCNACALIRVLNLGL